MDAAMLLTMDSIPASSVPVDSIASHLAVLLPPPPSNREAFLFRLMLSIDGRSYSDLHVIPQYRKKIVSLLV